MARIGELFDALLTLTMSVASLSVVLAIATGA